MAALAIGLAASAYFAASASREAKHATTALAQAELNGRKAEGINKFFTEEVFGLADPKRFDRTGITLLEALDIAAGKIETKFPDDPVLRAEILDQFGESYDGIDKPSRAIPALQKAVELRRSLGGEQDPATLESRHKLGWALFHAGRLEEARVMLQSVVDAQTAVLGAGNPDTLHTTIDLIVVLEDLRGWHVESRPGDQDLNIGQDAYRTALTKFGPTHPTTLCAESEVAWLLRGEANHVLQHERAPIFRIGGVQREISAARLEHAKNRDQHL